MAAPRPRPCQVNVFTVRSEELIEDRPELMAVVRPLLKARQAIEQQMRVASRRANPTPPSFREPNVLSAV
jgi:hypothetical protein